VTEPVDDGARLFWRLVQPRVDVGRLERGTIMGHPCARAGGAFVAMADPKTGALVVKLSGRRVAELIEEGAGRPFAPAGRVFKEWVAIPTADEALWQRLLDEATDGE
jgi:hypothetical protein